MTFLGGQDVVDPVTTMDVGVLVDVVDPQTSSSGGPNGRFPNSEPLGERLERIEFVRIDHARRRVVACRYLVNLSCCVVCGTTHTQRDSFTSTP